MSENPLAKLNQWEKGNITKAINRGIILCTPADKVVQSVATKFGLPLEVVQQLYDDQSALTPEALAERSKLLSKERHTKRGWMLTCLEYTYAQASEEGNSKVALQCLKLIMDLLDLKVKPGSKREKPIKANATEVKPTRLTDEELAEIAKNGIPK